MFRKNKKNKKSYIGSDFIRTNVPNNYGLADHKLAELIYANRPPWLTGEMSGCAAGAAVAHEIARLVTLETRFHIDEQNIRSCFNRYIVPNVRSIFERGWALGGCIIKPYFNHSLVEKDGDGFVKSITGTPRINVLFPALFDITQNDCSPNISGVKMFFPFEQNEQSFVLVEEQTVSETNVLTITNRLFERNSGAFDKRERLDNEIPLSSISALRRLPAELKMRDVNAPLVGYFMPAVVDNRNIYSKGGTSGLLRAADAIRRADMVINALDWEIGATYARLYIDETALFDRNDKQFSKYLVRTCANSDKQLFEKFSPDIRDQNYLNMYNAYMRQIEDIVGIARGVLSDASETAKTATEIMISKQRTYVTVLDNQKALKRAMVDLIVAIGVWFGARGEGDEDAIEQMIEFGDGIILNEEMYYGSDSEK